MAIKGPKAILSSAIANALDEYFVVDASKIESNLLRDAKIVLQHVSLREQVAHIPLNSAGKSTRITVTGCVEEVAFTWAWSVGDVAWVNDAMLTIRGANFQARLEHVDRIVEDDATAAVTSADEGRSLSESFVDPSAIDATSAKEIKKQKGGLAGFVERQVKMVMDMLTLKMFDFELRIVLPQTQPPANPSESSDLSVSVTNACDKVIAVGVKKIEIISFGRQAQEEAAGDAPLKLKQRINLDSFACGIHLESRDGGQSLVSYPFIDPFSYCTDVIRIGERFGGFMSGLEVVGLGQYKDASNDVASVTGSGFKAHVGTNQVEAMIQLSVMILAPPQDDAKSESPEETIALSSEHESNESGADEPSSFHFPLHSISLVFFEENLFVVSAIDVKYKADGTACFAEIGKMEYTSDANGQATATQIFITVRPSMKMTIGCIESLHIVDTVLLSNPIQSTEILYEGNTLVMKLDAIDVVTFKKKSADPAANSGPTVAAPTLPCNIDLCIQKGAQIKKSEDGSLVKFGKLRVYGLKEARGAKIAIQCESFRNYIVSMTTVSFCGSFPLDQVDVIEDFIFAAGGITVESGYSTDQWDEAFHPRKEKAKQPLEQSTKKSPPIKMPHANISDLKVTIGLQSAHKITKIKDTTLVIKAYNGKAETTSKDLVNYYSRACLSRVPDFISNSEVLGLNIVDSTAGMLSTWAGLGLGSTFGAGAGVAAITAVDAVKGTIDAGKRRRNASEESNWKPGDVIMGLVQAAQEATREGAAKRGRVGEGNLIDWTVGATANTTEYVVENKNRLGATGAGGGGFLLGMALGGPVGAIVGGLVATATTGATLERLDERNRCIEDAKGDSKSNALALRRK